jgi:signal transduction histidine kinase
MKKPPCLHDESRRLEALHAFEILDTDPERRFDELTELASMVCGTPIALISLIDENRQWFKSRKGLDARETEREISFCGHAIAQKDLFVVPDASQDDRFHDNPLVTNPPRVIFYAGKPILTNEGHALGTLCVIDHEARELDETQKKALDVLAEQVTAQFYLTRKNLELEKAFEKEQRHRKVIQEQKKNSIESARLASIGQMAGGIAHEINNPLGVIQMAKDQIERELQTDQLDLKKTHQACKTIEQTVSRMTQIIRGLRALSRDVQNDSPKSELLSDIVNQTLVVCSERFKAHGVNLKKEGDFGTKIYCRGGEISQILLNLLNNAHDAIVDSVKKWIRVEVVDDNKRVLLSVTDSGGGIEREVRRFIFEPFFTTKPVGEGTGLGLSISKEIARKHGGDLYIDENSPNTRFVLSLPKG